MLITIYNILYNNCVTYEYANILRIQKYQNYTNDSKE